MRTPAAMTRAHATDVRRGGHVVGVGLRAPVARSRKPAFSVTKKIGSPGRTACTTPSGLVHADCASGMPRRPAATRRRAAPGSTPPGPAARRVRSDGERRRCDRQGTAAAKPRAGRCDGTGDQRGFAHARWVHSTAGMWRRGRRAQRLRARAPCRERLRRAATTSTTATVGASRSGSVSNAPVGSDGSSWKASSSARVYDTDPCAR